MFEEVFETKGRQCHHSSANSALAPRSSASDGHFNMNVTLICFKLAVDLFCLLAYDFDLYEKICTTVHDGERQHTR